MLCIVVDSLISFQIGIVQFNENGEYWVVVNMQMSVEELFRKTEFEYQYDMGYKAGYEAGFKKGKARGIKKGKDNVILNMLADSYDDEVIQRVASCSKHYIQELKTKYSL